LRASILGPLIEEDVSRRRTHGQRGSGLRANSTDSRSLFDAIGGLRMQEVVMEGTPFGTARDYRIVN
jgi:hypothetical protein